ncbi:cytospin-B isoform X2 [Mustelus asterias]
MRSAVNKPVTPVNKQGSRSMDRPRASSLTSTTTKTSKYPLSFSTQSQLTKVKSRSSEELLPKAGGSLASNSSRLKKTITMGTITELTEDKARNSSGLNSSTRRSAIPTPRDSTTLGKDKLLSRERSRTLSNKKPTGPVDTVTPTRQVQTAPKSRAECEGTDRASLEAQIKELLTEAKVKELEISKLRSELKRQQDKHKKNDPEEFLVSPANTESQLMKLEEKNRSFQVELEELRAENGILQEQLHTFQQLREGAESVTDANSLSLEVSLNSDPSSSLHTPSSLDSSRNPAGGTLDMASLAINGVQSASSTAGMSSVTPSPDSVHCDRVFNPFSISRNGFKANTNSSDTSREGVVKNTSLVSAASLAEKIQQMEENQHSTTEELQATLQELSDQQQVVQELTAENEKLAEEKNILESSFQQQLERLQQLVREKERLVSVLQDGQSVKRGSELGDSTEPDQEKLLKLQQADSHCWDPEKEQQTGTAVLVQSLREEVSSLQRLLEAERERNASNTETLANSELGNQLEQQKLNLGECARESCELQELLRVTQSEKEQLEMECSALRETSLQATNEITRLHSLLVKVQHGLQVSESEGERQPEEPVQLAHTLQQETSDNESEIMQMKDTIFELQDQVEQHRVVTLHNNRTILELEAKVMTLEQRKLELERQLKMSNKKMKEKAEEWRHFQADLQTAVVVANDIKCEAQQEIRVLRKKVQEAEERSEQLQKELEILKGHRTRNEDLSLEQFRCDGEISCQRQTISRMPPESSPRVKTLIKSFNSSLPSASSFPSQLPAGPRGFHSGKVPPAAAVSPIQRRSASEFSGIATRSTLGQEPRSMLSKLTASGISVARVHGFKPFGNQSPSLSHESAYLPRSPGFIFRCPVTTLSCMDSPSKLRVERKDPLAPLAKEYGGSKRNALLKWCQKKTEGYPNIDITNFSSSWSDGLALCALLHSYLPAHIPYQQLCKQDRRNLTLAFQVAESVGIKSTLGLNELMSTGRPDWQSLMQYVAQIYKYFES